ncbi:CPBP family intramembrane glutamic endopeptidase [Flavimarina sp. Hel_I_48]|uniref:CPBP family intramembrane glutamic endopeptidase n=1 Tax=Flavimarina sp. Hel_I_48 TaxID=1392488 RepID=UPI0004DEEFB3|nr:CPBP family intramembrane glutamic endopeptidase [Flavimarina sp. Hel_I_48]
MFIAQAYRGKNEFWRYLIGSLVIGGAAVIGQLFFVVAIAVKVGFNENGNWDPQNLSKLSSFSETDFMHVFDSNVTLLLLLSSFALGFCALLLVIKHFHHLKLMDVTTTRPKFDWGRAFFAFGMIAVFTIVTTAIDYYFSPEDYQLNFQLVPFLILCVIAILLIPIQTSLEEYIFRGYLMQGFGILAKNKWFPLLMTSVIFGGMHLFNPEVAKLGYIIMVYYIGTGFLLGIMTLMDEGMELSLGFHAGNNLIAALLVTADWTAFQTESILKDISVPSAGFDILIPVLIIYPIFLSILAYRYKWTGWREKLLGNVEEPVNNNADPLITE